MAVLKTSKFPRDDNDCGWWHFHQPSGEFPALSEDLSCDYAVIGAGWTGLAAARRLAEFKPDARIAVLEAGHLGNGSAGRNSGFYYDLPFLFPADEFKGREEDGRQEIRLYRAIISELRDFVSSHNVNCDWSEIGQYHAAVSVEGADELKVIEASLDNLGEDYRTLGPVDLKKALGTDYYRSGIHTPGTVQINPLALIRALAHNMPDNVTVYENSPVKRIEGGNRPRLELNSGTVTAGEVLLTTNTFVRSFIGARSRLVPLVTFASITKPVDSALAPGGDSQWGVVPSGLFGTSMRRLSDNRYLVRSTYAYGVEYWGSERLKARAMERQMLSLRRRFPDAGNFQFEWSWSGLVSLFRGANGWFGKVEPKVYAAVSSGMPLCTLFGQQLAAHVVDAGGDALEFVRRRAHPSGLPPEPLLRYTVRALTSLRQNQEWMEI